MAGNPLLDRMQGGQATQAPSSNPLLANMQQQPQKKPGFIKSLVKDIVKPVARVVVGAYNTIKGADLNQSRNVPLLGQTQGLPDVIKPGGLISPQGKLQNPINLRNLGQAAGVGAELASNVVGGFGAKNVAKQGFKGAYTKAVKTGVKEGATSGALYGAGSGLQKENASVGSVLKDTAAGTAFGAAGGGIIGGGLGAASYGAGRLASKYIPGVAEKIAAQGDPRISNIIAQRQKALQTLEDSYSTVRSTTTKARERGIDSKKILAETDLLADAVDDTGTIRTMEAMNELNEFILPQENVIATNLAREGKIVPLSVVRMKMRSAISKSGLEGEALDNAYRKLDAELAGYGRKADANGNVPLAMIHSAKVNKYKNINYAGDPAVKQADKIIAKVLKRIVEDMSESIDAKRLNDELTSHYSVLSLLEKLDGKKVAGGKLGKYFAQLVGSVVGSNFGPLGSIAGAELAGRLKGGQMASTFSKKIGRNMVASDTMNAAVKQGASPLSPLEIVQREAKEAPKMLPAPKPGSNPNASRVEVPIPLPGPTSFEPQAKNIAYSKSSKSFGNRKSAQSTNITKANIAIDPTIPNKEKSVNLGSKLSNNKKKLAGVAAGALLSPAHNVKASPKEKEPRRSVFGGTMIRVNNNPTNDFGAQFQGGGYQGPVPGFRSNKIVGGYDIGSYATDPTHERKIANIFERVSNISSADDIHRYIRNIAPTSPISSDDVITAAREYKVDPRMVLAMMQQDSTFGTRGKAVRTRNPGNVGNDDSGRTVVFRTWLDGVRAVARNLSKRKVR